MRYLTVLSANLAIVSLMSCAAATGDEVCSAIEQAIKAAPQQFNAMKGAKDPDGEDMFFTSWRIAAASADDCSVMYDEDDGNTLYCSWKVASYATAFDEAQTLSARVENCLKVLGKYKAGEWDESTRSSSRFEFKQNARSFYAPTSSANDAEIHIGAICTTSKRTGKESCKTSISVDLKGDEK